MFALQVDGYTKASVPELISFYKRQKLELREDGIRLIRPISRPVYVINNDEVRTFDVLGQVSVFVLHVSGNDSHMQTKNLI